MDDPTREGALPDGIASLEFGAAMARAVLVFDDVDRSVGAARRALGLTESSRFPAAPRRSTGPASSA